MLAEDDGSPVAAAPATSPDPADGLPGPVEAAAGRDTDTEVAAEQPDAVVAREPDDADASVEPDEAVEAQSSEPESDDESARHVHDARSDGGREGPADAPAAADDVFPEPLPAGKPSESKDRDPAERQTSRYVLACAAIAAASQLLVAAHSSVGAPHEAEPEDELALRCAVAQARTAAGAMAVVAGRLLTRVREDEAQLLPGLPQPVRGEKGVTSPGLIVESEWRGTVRALASARAECAAARDALDECAAEEGLRRPIASLIHIADLMVTYLANSRLTSS
jgi:hypothetical protein